MNLKQIHHQIKLQINKLTKMTVDSNAYKFHKDEFLEKPRRVEKVKIKVKQSHYRPGKAVKVPGG